MDKQFRIKTFIKEGHQSECDEFVLGKISGIGYVLCNNEYPIIKTNDGYIYENVFTSAKYDDFINIIEKIYPGLCKFAYNSQKESK